MSRTQTIRCYDCGHNWTEDLSALDRRALVAYKGRRDPTCTYQVRCPKCHAVNVIEVREQDDE